MPGLWLLAPGNQVFWQLPPEENFPIEKEPGPAFSLLVPMKKCLKQLKSGSTGKERTKEKTQIYINDNSFRNAFIGGWTCWPGSFLSFVPLCEWSKHEELFLSCEPHSAAHPETGCWWCLPRYLTPTRDEKKNTGKSQRPAMKCVFYRMQNKNRSILGDLFPKMLL